MASLALGVKFIAAAGGTANFVNSSTVAGYLAASTLVNGATYRYRAESDDLSQWEYGTGTWNSGTSTLARTTIRASSTGSKVSFTVAPQVGIVAFEDDFLLTDEASAIGLSILAAASAAAVATAAGLVRVVKRQIFTASGTYTPSTGMLYCLIRCWGGGGGGGGVTGTANNVVVATGGGAGGYSELIASAGIINASKAVTIGAAGAGGAAGSNNGTAGGDTSVGALCIAKGGSHGLLGAFSYDVGGAGGVTTGAAGDITMPGEDADSVAGNIGGAGTGVIVGLSGRGGNTAIGSGGRGAVSYGAANAGKAATGKGAGGGGASATNTTSTAAGGAGTAGYIDIIEYCTQ